MEKTQTIKTFQTFYDKEDNTLILHFLDYDIEDTYPVKDLFDGNVTWRKSEDGKLVGVVIKNVTKSINLTTLKYSITRLIYTLAVVEPLAKEAKKKNIEKSFISPKEYAD